MAIHPLGTLTREGTATDRRTIAASLDQLASLGTREWCGYSFSWASAMEARAGRAEESWKYLDIYLKAFILRNGFHANGDQTNSGYSNFTYRPFTLEGNFAAAQAIHEMLLQSWNGSHPRVPRGARSLDGRLVHGSPGRGRLAVSARREGGRTTEVRIRAARDGEVRVSDPFDGARRHGPANRPDRMARSALSCSARARRWWDGRR